MSERRESPFLAEFNENIAAIRILLDERDRRRRGVEPTSRPNLTLIVGGTSAAVKVESDGDGVA